MSFYFFTKRWVYFQAESLYDVGLMNCDLIGSDYIDISPVLSSEIGVWPGDVPFSRKKTLSFSEGDHLELSSITTTLHLGAHADGPIHYDKDGVGIDKRSLESYLGKVQVVSVQIPRGERIHISDLRKTEIRAPRVLFRTGSFPDPNNWNEDFNSLSSELIEYLVEKSVKLVGIDTPSVDPQNDKGLESHTAIYKNDLAILEGLVLSEVDDGFYTLVALPLKIQGADASPVRAILVKGD